MWTKRAEILDTKAIKLTNRITDSISYENKLDKSINTIESFIGRYNGIDFNKLNLYLTIEELVSFKNKIKRYIAKLDSFLEKDLDSFTRKLIEKYKKNLEKFLSRVKINRKDSLFEELYFYAMELGIETYEECVGKVPSEVERAYKESSFDLAVMVGFALALSDIDFKALLEKEWKGNSFIGRIWKGCINFADSLRSIILQGFATRKSTSDITKDVIKKYSSFSKSNNRVVRSEILHQFEDMVKQSYDDYDIEKYVYMASDDEKTCEICGELDGQVFMLRDAMEGINYPLMHPNCRCSTKPYMSEGSSKVYLNGVNIDSSISFEDWEKLV